MVRPSARWAVMRSSVTSIVMIRGSLRVTMVMPCLQDVLAVVQNHGPDTVQFAGGKSMIRAQGHWGQPKLAYHALAAYVDMWGFLAIKTVEEKAIRTWDIGHCWHAIRLWMSQEA